MFGMARFASTKHKVKFALLSGLMMQFKHFLVETIKSAERSALSI